LLYQHGEAALLMRMIILLLQHWWIVLSSWHMISIGMAVTLALLQGYHGAKRLVNLQRALYHSKSLSWVCRCMDDAGKIKISINQCIILILKRLCKHPISSPSMILRMEHILNMKKRLKCAYILMMSVHYTKD
jgi:hypothetical protein